MFPVSTKMTSGRLLLLLPLTLSIRPCGSDIIPTVSSSVTPPDASTRASLTSPRPGTQITSILRTPQTPTLTPHTLLHLQTINSHLSLQNMLWLFGSPLSCHQVKKSYFLFQVWSAPMPTIFKANTAPLTTCSVSLPTTASLTLLSIRQVGTKYFRKLEILKNCTEKLNWNYIFGWSKLLKMQCR